MTEMVERVARAIANAPAWHDLTRLEELSMARAAIEAMRVGKRGQISVEQAGGDKLREYHNDDEAHYPVETACAVFDAMIAAALAPKVDT